MIIVCCVNAIESYKLSIRNKKVAVFRNLILSKIYNYLYKNNKTITLGDINTILKQYIDKWTYEEMLYSDKPLTLENWYTSEELQILNAI